MPQSIQRRAVYSSCMDPATKNFLHEGAGPPVFLVPACLVQRSCITLGASKRGRAGADVLPLPTLLGILRVALPAGVECPGSLTRLCGFHCAIHSLNRRQVLHRFFFLVGFRSGEAPSHWSRYPAEPFMMDSQSILLFSDVPEKPSPEDRFHKPSRAPTGGRRWG